jgi:hypothetical protein
LMRKLCTNRITSTLQYYNNIKAFRTTRTEINIYFHIN